MKYDVVLTSCGREGFWPAVRAGLHANREHIEKLIVVDTSKEPKFVNALLNARETDLKRLPFPVEVQHLPHQHEKHFNVASAMNAGARDVRTPMFWHVDDDIILPKGTFERMLMGTPQRDLTFAHGKNHELTSLFEIPKLVDVAPPGCRRIAYHPCEIASGAIFLANTSMFRVLGGWNTGMTGYGMQDQEFTARWMIEYGIDSVALAPTGVWHIGPHRSGADRDPENERIFLDVVATFDRLYGKKPKVIHES